MHASDRIAELFAAREVPGSLFSALPMELRRRTLHRRLHSCHGRRMAQLDELGASRLVAPELQALHEQTCLGVTRFVHGVLLTLAGLERLNPLRLPAAEWVGRVEGLDVDRGDVHPGGVSTTWIRAQGEEWYFKPRAFGFERALFAWIHENPEWGLAVPETLFLADATLMKAVAPTPAQRAQAGSLLRSLVNLQHLAYLTGLSDLHKENVLVREHHLVVVDAEVSNPQRHRLLRSRTCLLPEFNHVEGGERQDISLAGQLIDSLGLTADEAREGLRIATEYLRSEGGRMHESLESHFRAPLTYRALRMPTADYKKIIAYWDDLYFVRNPPEGVPPEFSGVLESEVEPLRQGAVPIHQADTVPLAGRTGPQPDADAVEEGIWYTSTYCDKSLGALFRARCQGQDEDGSCVSSGPGLAPGSESALHADVCARVGASLRVGAGEVVGLDVARIPDSRAFHAVQLEDGVYDGLDGLLLYLSAMSRCGYTRRDTALGAVHRRWADVRTRAAGASLGYTSLVSGWASAAWGTLSSARLLGEDDLARSAADFLLTCLAEAGDLPSLDLFYGPSGALLLAARMVDSVGDPRFGPVGEHFLGRIEDSLADGRLPALPDKFGFAHGLSGVAFSVAVWAKTRRDARANRLLEALVGEMHRACVLARNEIRDGRDSSRPANPSYCNGAFGLYLALRCIRDCGPAADVKGWVADLMEASRVRLPARQTVGYADICCSDFGRLEVPDLGLDGFAPRLQPAGPGASLNLFKGLSGLSYVLARRRHGILPNLLLWEI